jgi:hypothetical protein
MCLPHRTPSARKSRQRLRRESLPSAAEPASEPKMPPDGARCERARRNQCTSRHICGCGLLPSGPGQRLRHLMIPDVGPHLAAKHPNDARPTVNADSRMCRPMTHANWIRDSNSGSRCTSVLPHLIPSHHITSDHKETACAERVDSYKNHTLLSASSIQFSSRLAVATSLYSSQAA